MAEKVSPELERASKKTAERFFLRSGSDPDQSKKKADLAWPAFVKDAAPIISAALEQPSESLMQDIEAWCEEESDKGLVELLRSHICGGQRDA